MIERARAIDIGGGCMGASTAYNHCLLGFEKGASIRSRYATKGSRPPLSRLAS